MWYAKNWCFLQKKYKCSDFSHFWWIVVLFERQGDVKYFEQEKKEEIWLSPMTKAPTPTEMSKGQSDNTNNATKKFD